jgi:rSAM/selenodomain-associated transferase 2
VTGRVSVVIPTLDEAARIGALVAGLRNEEELADIIVADSGSSDDTAIPAARMGARVVSGARGRGAALCAGAAAAKGEILLFLHADSVFPAGGLAAITAALDRSPRAPGGNFCVVFDGEHSFHRWLTRTYAWVRRFALYYGDSGIFVRRSVYDAIGGMKPLALMEDWEFVRRLERAGPTIRVDDPPLVTSSRKFAGRHPAAVIGGLTLIHFLYWFGVPPQRLARIYYRRGRGRQP